MSSFLKIERRGAVLTLTMNQPEVRNVLTGNTAIEEFVTACAEISKDTSVRAVIITGEGSAFCAGGNLKDMQRYSNENIAADIIRDEYRHGIQRLPLAIYNLEVPTIAAVNGPAIGAGCDLACMCDIRIATEKAYFAESFIKLGLIPGDGGAWLLPRVVGMSRAAEMSFTGNTVTAAEAVAYGLVSRLVPADKLLEEANTLADQIAANPGPALRMTKRLLREGQHLRLDSLLELSAGFQALAHQTPHHIEAVAAFVEKRPPQFPQT
jgi:enoyl-CoA hydratase/carnithine racemase